MSPGNAYATHVVGLTFSFSFYNTTPPQFYTLSYTTLFRSHRSLCHADCPDSREGSGGKNDAVLPLDRCHTCSQAGRVGGTDRKSTRLNSIHMSNSYAEFCLKKDVGDESCALCPFRSVLCMS